MLSLDVTISTYRPEGILRVEKMLSSLSPQEGVSYIVSWQEHQEAPVPQSLLTRSDVEIHRFDIKGLSNNRNNAISHCKGDIVLVADDDLEYKQNFSRTIIKVFEDNPDIDLATFKIDFPFKKTYPEKECPILIPFPKNFYVNSNEIAFRRERMKNLKFSPDLGLGNSFRECGEEEMFLLSAIRLNKKCLFVPEEIALHKEFTTGDKVRPGILRGQGLVIREIYPISYIPRLVLKAWRTARSKDTSFLSNLFYLWQGSRK